MAKWVFTEEDVARTLGVGRGRVAELRKGKLTAGDTGMVKGRLLYSAQAVRRLVDALLEKKDAAAEGSAVAVLQDQAGGALKPGVLPGILDAVVTKIYEKNPQFLEARMGEREITVRVRDNRNFTAGMTIESRALVRGSPENDRLYDFVGRCPRWRGNW